MEGGDGSDVKNAQKAADTAPAESEASPAGTKRALDEGGGDPDAKRPTLESSASGLKPAPALKLEKPNAPPDQGNGKIALVPNAPEPAPAEAPVRTAMRAMIPSARAGYLIGPRGRAPQPALISRQKG